jgi:hypothetical protein
VQKFLVGLGFDVVYFEGCAFGVDDYAVAFGFHTCRHVFEQAFLAVKVDIELRDQADIGVSGSSGGVDCQEA